MKVIVDGQNDQIKVSEGADLSKIIEQIEATLMAASLAVKDSKLNGQELNLDEIDEKFRLKAPLAEDTLEITTVPLVDHLHFLLDQVCENLNRMEEEIVTIAENYMKVDNRESLDQVSSWCTDMSGMLTNLQDLNRIFSVDTSTLEIGKNSFVDGISKIHENLTQLTEAMEKDDRTTVADMLEFEMTGYISGLKEIFPKLKESVSSAVASN